MIIDSHINSAKINIGFVLTAIISLGTAFIIFWAGYYINEPINIIFPLLFLIAYLFLHLCNFYYLHVKTDGQYIVLRYMYLHPFLGKKKMIKISYPNLKSYTVEKSFFGLNRSLLLTYHSAKETIHFPPVSISILTKKEEQRLTGELNAIIQAHKS